MHTIFYNFKTALYSSAVVLKGFNISRKFTVKLKASLFLNVPLCIRPLTFINEALCLSGSPFVASNVPPQFSLAGVHDMLC